MAIAFVFPGQGSQSVGMLNDFVGNAAVDALLIRADAALHQPGVPSLSQLIAQGPAEALSLTVNTQPAMLLAGLACFEAWRAAGGPSPDFVAGHSLGEYTALAAANSISLEVALKLVRLRAQAMQEAVPVGQGAMAAILGLEDAAVIAACLSSSSPENGVVEAVNFNAPAQVVIAGNKLAVEKACEAAKEAGAKRAMLLPVSAPFHSSLLRPAGERLKLALQDIELRSPSCGFVNNVDVAELSDPQKIKDGLVRQAYGPVRWVELVRNLQERGVSHFIEYGPGKVLGGMIKRIVPGVKISAVYDRASLEAVLAEVK
jgi:[acyl-carrier-protein] S-malonyltransferase